MGFFNLAHVLQIIKRNRVLHWILALLQHPTPDLTTALPTELPTALETRTASARLTGQLRHC
jgi:hypothetical protein